MGYRSIYKIIIIATITCLSVEAGAQSPLYELDASGQHIQTPSPIGMEATSPDGTMLSVNSRYFIKNGKPWFPVMGEFHFTRYPHRYWEEELLKMKMAGISIVATYVFWNAHENPQGVWNWKGDRDLRTFISLCRKHGLYTWLRIGPWSHGEQLYGGFPEWIEHMKNTRKNDSAYLEQVGILFNQVSRQTKGMFFKDGGPVIGVQLENEYASGEKDHIATLKKMALNAGITPVYFSITANTVFNDTSFEALPLQGSYPYRGWEAGGGGPTKDFLYANDQWIMTADLGKLYYQVDKYPKGLCEQGCGSQITYTNRFVVEPDVVEAHLQNQIGRGMNMVGYYMFQGGTQLPGLKEPGLPESYDFQAPLDEFGLPRVSYKYLKILHAFINDFGEELAPMQVIQQASKVTDEHNTDSLRYIGRFSGDHGYVFINNTQVRVPMPDKVFTLKIHLPGNETILLPRGSLTLPGQETAILPINLRAADVLVKYSTAQPLARFSNGGVDYLFLTAVPGMQAELLLDASTVKDIRTQGGTIDKSTGKIYILKTGENETRIDITSSTGKHLAVMIVTRKQAENSWRTLLRGKEYILFSDADVIVNNTNIELRKLDDPVMHLAVFPTRPSPLFACIQSPKPTLGGLFDYYIIRLPKTNTSVGIKNVAGDKTMLSLPAKMPDNTCDIFLKIDYKGSSAEAWINNKIAADNLYNGVPWNLGLKRYIQRDPRASSIEIKIKPWVEGITGVSEETARILKNSGPDIHIQALPQYETILHLKGF